MRSRDRPGGDCLLVEEGIWGTVEEGPGAPPLGSRLWRGVRRWVAAARPSRRVPRPASGSDPAACGPARPGPRPPCAGCGCWARRRPRPRPGAARAGGGSGAGGGGPAPSGGAGGRPRVGRSGGSAAVCGPRACRRPASRAVADGVGARPAWVAGGCGVGPRRRGCWWSRRGQTSRSEPAAISGLTCSLRAVECGEVARSGAKWGAVPQAPAETRPPTGGSTSARTPTATPSPAPPPDQAQTEATSAPDRRTRPEARSPTSSRR